MKRNSRKRQVLLVAVACALLLPATVALGGNGGGYDVSWWTVDGGGRTGGDGGGYNVQGTAGQPDAAVWGEGTPYNLVGGFWGGASPHPYRIYLPLVMR